MGAAALAVAAFGATDPWVWAPLACALLVGLGVLCFGATLAGWPLPWHRLLWVALAFGVLVVGQIATGQTVYGGATWTGLAQLGGPAAMLYLSLFAFRSNRRLETLANLAWWAVLALAVEAIFQYATAGGFIYWYRNATYATPLGPYVYHNHFAGCMDLLLPLALAALFLPARGGRIKPTAQCGLEGLVPALGLGAVVMGVSRGGIMALLVEALAAALLLWRAGRLRWRGLVAGAWAGALVAAAANWQPLTQRLLNLQRRDVSATDRLWMLRGCLAIWHAYPWFGSGFNTFAAVYPQYQLRNPGATVLMAHNEYAQLLAEMGVVGIAVALAFVGLAAYSYAQGPRHGTAGLVRRAAWVGAIGFMAHSAVDFQFHSPANALLFFLVIGAATATVARVAAPTGVARGQRRAEVMAQGR